MSKKRSDTIILHLSSLTPSDATLEVMAEYLKDLHGIIGDIEGITFEKVKKGSAQLQMRATDKAQLEAKQRFSDVSSGGGTAEQQKYFEALQRQNAKCHTRATLKVASKTIPIPTLKLEPTQYSISEYTEAEAKIVRLGGVDDSVPMTCLDRMGLTIRCNVNIVMAKELKQYLLEEVYLRLSGEGNWKKDNDHWFLNSLDVKSYSLIIDEEIEDFGAISDLSESTWAKEKQPFQKLRQNQGKRTEK